MSDLSEFLLARIAEDQADAMVGWRWKTLPAGEYSRLQARVLAECDAKRRIVRELETTHKAARAFPGGSGRLAVTYGLDAILRLLALPYVDHPDYRSEWAP